MTTTNELSHSEQQAASQLESIKQMIAAVECDYDRLAELREERSSYMGDRDGETEEAWADEFAADAEELAELVEAAGDCDDAEDAETRINEDPLSVEVRSGWAASKAEFEAEEYCILLCTGGPACRIIGDLNNGEPTSARLEHQDWGTSWQEHITRGSDHDALLKYARKFFYGE